MATTFPYTEAGPNHVHNAQGWGIVAPCCPPCRGTAHGGRLRPPNAGQTPLVWGENEVIPPHRGRGWKTTTKGHPMISTDIAATQKLTAATDRTLRACRRVHESFDWSNDEVIDHRAVEDMMESCRVMMEIEADTFGFFIDAPAKSLIAELLGAACDRADEVDEYVADLVTFCDTGFNPEGDGTDDLSDLLHLVELHEGS